MLNYLSVYYGLINILVFLLMATDKRKAIKGKWRIPEATLLLPAFLGGAVGALSGMFIFHHKTRHPKFIILVPLACILNFAVIYFLFTTHMI